jgi:hypothetical protein
VLVEDGEICASRPFIWGKGNYVEIWLLERCPHTMYSLRSSSDYAATDTLFMVISMNSENHESLKNKCSEVRGRMIGLETKIFNTFFGEQKVRQEGLNTINRWIYRMQNKANEIAGEADSLLQQCDPSDIAIIDRHLKEKMVRRVPDLAVAKTTHDNALNESTEIARIWENSDSIEKIMHFANVLRLCAFVNVPLAPGKSRSELENACFRVGELIRL